MHSLNPEIRRPLLQRTLSQSLTLVAAIVAMLSLSSYAVARALLLERAELHIVTLGQVTVDLVEQELADMRRQSQAIAKFATQNPAVTADSFAEEYPLLRGLNVDATAAAETAVTPVVDHNGWQSVAVRTPAGTGAIVATFTVRPLLERLAVAAKAAGQTADILFGRSVDGNLELLRVTAPNERAAILIGPLATQEEQGLMLAKALKGENRRGMDNDYRGKDVVSAGRFLPSLGWGVSAQIDAEEVLEGVRLLATFHLLLGLAFLGIAGVLSFWLARCWTAPVRSLAARFSELGPGHWDLRPQLRSDDEVAFLERIASNMAARLREFTENLERLVQQRTQALRRQYELDRTVLTSVEYGVVTVDRDARVTGLNPAAERLLCLTESTAMGMDAQRAMPLSTDGKTFLKEDHPLKRALNEGTVRTLPGTVWTLAPEGSEARSLTLVATPLKTGTELFGAVVVFQDITEERQMEQLKSEFITLASHQLRTPLSIMQWQLEAMRGSVSVEPSQVEEMDGAAKRMTAIVNALLQVAKLEGGALTPTFAPLDVAGLLQEAVQEAGKTAPHGVGIRIDTVSSVPSVTDAVLLKVVLQNLLENAVKYSKEHGEVAVTLRADDAIRIVIRDDGMGIPVEEQRHVFEKFFRGKNVRKQSTDGTGLGLYIAKMIAEQLGGTLAFESTEGKGTTFVLVLPKEPKTTA